MKVLASTSVFGLNARIVVIEKSVHVQIEINDNCPHSDNSNPWETVEQFSKTKIGVKNAFEKLDRVMRDQYKEAVL